MFLLKICLLFQVFYFLTVITDKGYTKAVPEPAIRSDVIQTKFGPDPDADPDKPGWMRRQLMRFGEMAGRVGNSLGKHATVVTNAIDKVCEVVKTVIPLLAAVCHVGQFKFCTATEEAPLKLADALAPSLDLNLPD